MKFNKGKPYHGSEEVFNGKLRGATVGTDYFYFFCPHCAGKQILRVLDYGLHNEEPDVSEYNYQYKSKLVKGFTLVFQLYCEKCKFTDFVKLSNTAWQGGDADKVI